MRGPIKAFCLAASTTFAVLHAPALAAAEAVDLSDPAQAMETWIRLKSDLSGEVTYEWMTGRVYGVPTDAPSQHLFSIESVTVRQTKMIGDGVYQERNFACRLYKDAQTGDYIDSWFNPYTEEEVSFSISCNPGLPLKLSAAGLEIETEISYESTAVNTPMVFERTQAGGHIILRHDAHATFTVPSSGEVRRELSIDTFKLTAEDLDNPELTSLSPTYSWVSNTHWMSIFGMQEVPGHMIWSLNGQKFERADQLPEDFRTALERFVPGGLERFQEKWEPVFRPETR